MVLFLRWYNLVLLLLLLFLLSLEMLMQLVFVGDRGKSLSTEWLSVDSANRNTDRYLLVTSDDYSRLGKLS